MKQRYRVIVDSGVYVSDSRDSKQHLKNHGGTMCAVFTMHGKLVSAARRDENDNIYREHINYK